MSENTFGLHRGREEEGVVETKDRICREEGGYGYCYADLPGEGWRGWFSAPHRGQPFDRDLARRVLERVEREIDDDDGGEP
jgi:hypothetical protein